MITALGPRLGLGLRLDFGSQVWFVQYFSEKKVIVLYAAARYSPPSSILLREMVKGTEQSCYAQAEVLGADRPCRGPC